METRTYTRPQYRGGGQVTVSLLPCGNKISVQCGDVVKTVTVRKSREYVYKCTKTGVSAIGGAKGLFDYITGALPHGLFEVYAWQAIGHILQVGK